MQINLNQKHYKHNIGIRPRLGIKTLSGICVLQLAQRIRRTNVRDLHTEYVGAAGSNAIESGTGRVW